jgi:uncharacterized MAPEG superfamily protein
LPPILYWTAAAALLIALMWVPYVLDRMIQRGLIGAMSNPDEDDAPPSAWGFRCQRAHIVAVESFTAFAPLALMAGLATEDKGGSGTAALIYLCGLAAHYIVYTLGVPVLRTVAFLVCVGATVSVGLNILGFGG